MIETEVEMTRRSTFLATALVAGLATAALGLGSTAQAQGYGPGWGMMGGYGPGYADRADSGPGYGPGYGPGWMHRNGPGYGPGYRHRARYRADDRNDGPGYGPGWMRDYCFGRQGWR